jgi:hypothetical protein
MKVSATRSLKLCVVLDAAEIRIQATVGIPHNEFWRQWMRNSMMRRE